MNEVQLQDEVRRAGRRPAVTARTWRTPLRGRAWYGAGPGRAAAVAAAVIAVAGCGSAPAGGPAGSGPNGTATQAAAPKPTATPGTASGAAPLPAGRQGNRQQVPWARVGPGWFLAEWSPIAPHAPGQGHPKPAAMTLFLVDPAGGRYRIETLPAGSNPSGPPEYITAWSGDGQRALLTNGAGAKAAVLDLRTGVSTEFRLGANVAPIGFTAPHGLAIIANTAAGNTNPGLERLSLTGTRELVYPTSFGRGGTYRGTARYSADGTELAVGTSAGVELISNRGTAIRFLPVVRTADGCAVVRWWTAADLLVGCTPGNSNVEQLWLVPVSGAPPSALTANPAARGDFGDIGAWQIPAGTFVQDMGACGYLYVAKLRPDRRTAPVSIPGVAGVTSTIMVGALGNRLAVNAVPSCSSGGKLLWYVPATHAVTTLLGGAANGGSVTDVIMFGEP